MEMMRCPCIFYGEYPYRPSFWRIKKTICSKVYEIEIRLLVFAEIFTKHSGNVKWKIYIGATKHTLCTVFSCFIVPFESFVVFFLDEAFEANYSLCLSGAIVCCAKPKAIRIRLYSIQKKTIIRILSDVFTINCSYSLFGFV